MKINRLFLLLLLTATLQLQAQNLSGLRSRMVAVSGDTITVDSLSIIPGSESIFLGTTRLETGSYFLDAPRGRLYIRGAHAGDSLSITYRVFPFSLTAEHFLRDRKVLNARVEGAGTEPVYVESIERSPSIFGLDGLTRSGSISRGITVGNNQDAVLNSSLNLQLAGKIGGNVELLAAITDDNIPIQAEGNTQQLQEFDKVFIQLSNPVHKLIAGDFEIRNPDGYFMRYYKKGQGGWYSFKSPVTELGVSKGLISGGVSASVSKGKFARYTFNGIESNQGPYRLRGAENETYIVILSGSERIFLDGILLDRGQDRDYVVDYNTAELTFTTKRIITKDSRIVAEYQYSDKTYARTLLTGNTGWESHRLKATVAFYSEQDSKNQPLQQTLSDADKLLLASVGDSVSLAVAPNIDSVAYTVNEILYARLDTTVNSISYSPIYVYSTNADSAHYRVGFANVGQGKGNYIAVDGTANGRIYQWVAPLNGIPQGTYDPVVQLISPKQRQMLTAGLSWKASSSTDISVEFAGTKDDVNRFSALDKSNDNGGAVKVGVNHRHLLSADTLNGWRLGVSLQSEISDRKFKPIENYRSVEFTRDWNTAGITSLDDEVFTNATVSLSKPQKAMVQYSTRSYERSTSYHGFMHSVVANWQPGPLAFSTDAGYLTTTGAVFNSSYLRHRDEVKLRKGRWLPGLRLQQERNEIRLKGSDTLSASSYSNRTAEAFVMRGDSLTFPLLLSVSRRADDAIARNAFTLATNADMASIRSGIHSGGHRIDVQANYRNLTVEDSTRTTIQAEESSSGRVEYSGTLVKGGVQLSTFYEAGNGQEPRKRISYIQVAPGTGTYAWKDYNGDGVPQLNEFEVAAYSDEAGYIRVLTPTDEYEKVFFNQWNAALNVSPSAWFKGGAKRPFWSRVAVSSSVSFTNRVSAAGKAERWNPIASTIVDTALLSTSSSARHVLYLNRGQSLFSADVSWQDQQSRQLLSNGIEGRRNSTAGAVVRWNINNWVGTNTSGEAGTKKSESEAYADRDFQIDRWNVIERVSLQPGSTWRVTFSYRHEHKQNVQPGSAQEKTELEDGGLEVRYSELKKGIFSARFNVVSILYTGENNTALAYEMLESLKKGTNLTWGCSMQRNLGSGLQLSLLYEGRKPTGIKAIHTGSVQVRAYF